MGKSSIMLNGHVRRLFMVAPSEIYEHPPTLSLYTHEIEEGPIKEFEVYVCDYPGCNITYEKNPVIRARYDLSLRRLFIEINEMRFWYEPKDHTKVSRYDRPCWYQSGITLRFIRKGL